MIMAYSFSKFKKFMLWDSNQDLNSYSNNNTICRKWPHLGWLSGYWASITMRKLVIASTKPNCFQSKQVIIHIAYLITSIRQINHSANLIRDICK